MALKLFRPYVSWRSVWNVVRVLFSGQLAEGPEVRKFEREFANFHYLEPSSVVALNSGTAALEIAAHLLDLKPDDEVIIPVLTCAATVVPFARRCKVVFADVADDLNVDVADVRRKLTDRTRAIVFVRFGGSHRGLAEILGIVGEPSKRSVRVIDDAAQATDLRLAHWHADFTAVSLQATKTLTSGDGGFLVCREPFASAARKLRWFGLERGKPLDGQVIADPGYKYHMNDIAAAIGRGNLRALPKLLRHRKKLGKIYRDAGMWVQPWLAGVVGEKPNLRGAEVGQHHYRQDKTFGIRSDCPNMDRLEGRYWFVPYGHHVSVRQAKRIANALR